MTAAELYELRRLVLRTGTPSDDVVFGLDDEPTTVHLAVRDEHSAIVACATWAEHESPDLAGVPALQLRGMAVDDEHRRRGLGDALIAAGVDLAAERGITTLWANARDTALDFYRHAGFDVVGDGFLTTDTRLPHHRILRHLRPEDGGVGAAQGGRT